MSTNKNVLKFSIGANTSEKFHNETTLKLMQLGFTLAGNDEGEVILIYQHGDEIPFEVANHAKVLMEKHAPEYPLNKIERFDEIVDKVHEESEQDLKHEEAEHESAKAEEEVENSLEHEAEHTEE